MGALTVVGVLLLLLVCLAVYDRLQRKHAIIANYPILGRFRYLFETVGPPLRQYIVTSNDEERPFSRDQRRWVYASSKKENNYFGFGTDNDLELTPGYLVIRQATFPINPPAPSSPEYDHHYTCPGAKVLGGWRGRKRAFRPSSVVNTSAMSYGSLSGAAVEAINRGVKLAGAMQNTGEGGISDHHRKGGDILWQLGTGYFGARDSKGNFSMERFLETVASAPVRAIEIKLSQGAKPGKGGVLLGAKVTEEIAAIRGIPAGADSLSPNRHRDVANADQLLDMVARVREATGKPVGVKTAIGGWNFMNELCEAVARRGAGFAPDFIAVDGGEGGSGAAPQALADHMALSIDEALPRVVDALIEAGLRDRVRVIAAGKLVTSARAAWALAAGADFVNTARGFMFALGCIQALRCHTNTCPTGIATHNPRLQRGLVVEDKAERVAHYCRNMNREIDMIAHSCGLRHAREFRREHVRIVQAGGQSVALSTLYPYPSS